MALDALGLRRPPRSRCLESAQGLRLPDGSYWTGTVYPELVTFPEAGAGTTYTAGAIHPGGRHAVGATGAAGLFRGEHLPDTIDLAEPWCTGRRRAAHRIP